MLWSNSMSALCLRWKGLSWSKRQGIKNDKRILKLYASEIYEFIEKLDWKLIHVCWDSEPFRDWDLHYSWLTTMSKEEIFRFRLSSKSFRITKERNVSSMVNSFSSKSSAKQWCVTRHERVNYLQNVTTLHTE